MGWMAGATLAAGGLNFLGAQAQNRANAKMARQQMDFQEHMSSTAYQRAMHDMELAGLNPILAYQQGGASSPAGASMAQQNEIGAAASSALDARRMFADIAKIKSDTDLNKALESVARQEAQVKGATAKNLQTQLPGLETEAKIDKSTWGKVFRFLQRANPMSNFIRATK